MQQFVSRPLPTADQTTVCATAVGRQCCTLCCGVPVAVACSCHWSMLQMRPQCGCFVLQHSFSCILRGVWCAVLQVFGAAACLSTHWVPGAGVPVAWLAAGNIPDPNTHRSGH